MTGTTGASVGTTKATVGIVGMDEGSDDKAIEGAALELADGPDDGAVEGY